GGGGVGRVRGRVARATSRSIFRSIAWDSATGSSWSRSATQAAPAALSPSGHACTRSSGVRLPGYAPDLNPTELVWGNVKGQELANLCSDNLGEVERAGRTGLRRVRRAPTLAFAFLRHAGLSA